MLPSSRISIYSSAIHHTRNLNETWENAKNSAVDTFEGFKYTVQRNLIVSICVGTILICLLILCVYLRCKHQRVAKTMTKEQLDELMAQRAERKRINEENRMLKRRRRVEKMRRMKQAKAQAKADAYAQRLQLQEQEQEQDGSDVAKRSLEKEQDESDLANTSIETKATILSDTDIEKDGIEIALDGYSSPRRGEMENEEVQDESDLVNPLIEINSTVPSTAHNDHHDIEKGDLQTEFDSSVSPIKADMQNNDSSVKKSSGGGRNDDYFDGYKLLSANIEM